MPRKKPQIERSKSASKKPIGVITREKQIAMVRRARRESDIESGVSAVKQGTGPWGGTKRQQRRRKRRSALEEVRNLEDEQEG
jgi:hypothetical protein